MMQAVTSGRCRYLTLCVVLFTLLFLSACGKGVISSASSGTVQPSTATVVGMTASAQTIAAGQPVTLTVTVTNANTVLITNNVDSTSLPVSAGGGTVTVKSGQTTTYTVTATGANNQQATAQVTVTVTVKATGTVALINHVIFLMQENRTFDTYFGMLNPYRKSGNPSGTAWNIGDDGKEYDVDGLAGTNGVVANFSNTNDPPAGTTFPLFKFATACIDDMTSDWLGSYGDVSRYNFTTQRKILMDGFVHIAENYAVSCQGGACGSGNLTDDLPGQRAMGYYDQGFLNYYYYMASQFALSDRWFSPVASKSTPNRIATLTGGTTQGLVYDPFKDDKFTTQLAIPTIFSKLDKAGVSWRIYYGITQGDCLDPDGNCGTSKLSAFPSITFSDFTDSYKYLYVPATKGICTAPTIPSGTAVADSQNAFCIDPTHIAPISQYFTDVTNGTLPSFAFVEPAYGINDEHPGSGQSILSGQVQVAKMVNALMNSPSWKDSVFFLSYDEGGGPYDHVPPVPGHTNDFTNSALGITTDISSIAVNADTYFPCPAPIDPVTLLPTPTLHCDLVSRGTFADPGYNAGDAAAVQGFAAQLGFRLPNLVISPFTRKHYVSHVPMDHTAILRFVEDRFIGDQKYLTLRDAAQPNLLDFFDFVNVPWATPPTQSAIPTPVPATGTTCTPATMQ
jgi:phospholipase C